jgi:hypothetical protein
MGNVPFSPVLQNCSRRIQLLKALERKKKGTKVSSRMIQRLFVKTGLSPDLRSSPLDSITHLIQQEYLKYYQIKRDAKELRITYLESLAEAIAEHTDSTKEKTLKDLRSRENQRASARRIKYLRGTLQKNKTTKVTILRPDGTCQDLTSKDEIEEAILAENFAKYRQASHSPFMQPPLCYDFGFKGLGPISQSLLHGTYEPIDPIPNLQQEFLHEFQMPPSIRDFPPELDILPLQEYQCFWQRANECTACYPDSLSFSSMKAGSFSDIGSDLECTLIRIALKTGYTFNHWKKCTDVMIPKKAGLSELTSLRTIVLFQVDCNYAFEYTGCLLMQLAESTQSLAPEQYGSRKHHKAIDLAVNKSLTNDIFRQLK